MSTSRKIVLNIEIGKEKHKNHEKLLVKSINPLKTTKITNHKQLECVTIKGFLLIKMRG